MRALKFTAKVALAVAGFLLINAIIGYSNTILHTYQDFFAWVTCITMIGGPIAILVWLLKGSN